MSSAEKIKKLVLALILPIGVLGATLLVKPEIVSAQATKCVVQEATFKPYGVQKESPNWYNDKKKPEVVVDILTRSCEGRTIKVSITEDDGFGILNDDDVEGEDFIQTGGRWTEDMPVVVPTSNHIIIKFKAGEAMCESYFTWGWDCNYYISVYDLDGRDYTSENHPRGRLLYECDTACEEDWEFLSLERVAGTVSETKVKYDDETVYEPLAPLPGLGEVINTKDDCAFGKYLNTIIRLVMAIAAALAMIMIIYGGVQYMTSELVSGKEAGKETVQHALLGLLLALSSWLILNTINPDLLKACLKLQEVKIMFEGWGESPDNFEPLSKESLQAIGITKCTGTGGKAAIQEVGQQFIGKTIYSQEAGKRNKIQGSKVILDCSAYVAQVYDCVGLPTPGGDTTSIFSSGNTTQVNGQTYDFNILHNGDLVGWKKSDDPKGQGHVAIYLGGGKILDAQPGGTLVRELSSIRNRIRYVKWP